jgi:hypothetical protein
MTKRPRKKAARRPARRVLAKGNPLGRAFPQSAPDRSAYGPKPAAFGPNAPPPPDTVAQDASESLAPRPLIDKYPIIIGAGLTFAYLSAVQRIALTGYRMQYVDLLREILERDPHLYAVAWKPILAIANGRLEITPAELPGGDPDTERAQEIAEDVERRIRRIRGLKQSIASLGWGAFYGVAAAENHYKRDRDGGYYIDHLGFIHSRRCAYPDSQSWDLYIWDQGQVVGNEPYGQSPTNSNIYGLRVADFPFKFIVYAPQLSGDYPTREGSGRLVAEWALIKRAAARNALKYLEQFSRPLPEVTYNTADPDGQGPAKPREASDEDVDAAEAAAAAIASGALASYVHADSIKVALLTPEARNNKITFDKLLEVCNEEESKGALGSTLTTSVGAHGGNRALGTVHQNEEKNVFSFFADTMSESLWEQLVTPLTLLNHKNAEHLIPQLKIHVEDEDPAGLLKLANEASEHNVPVDADELAAQVGLPVVPKPKAVKFRTMMPLDVTAPTDLDPELAPKPGPGTAAGAKLENEKTKASQSHIVGAPPGAPPNAGHAPVSKDEDNDNESESKSSSEPDKAPPAKEPAK